MSGVADLPSTSGNPRGRPKRKPTALGKIANNVFHTSVRYRDDGRLKNATRRELSLRTLVKHALSGNVTAAGMLLKLRSRAQASEVGVQRIVVDNWLPDHQGQMGEQKSRQHMNEADLKSSGRQPSTRKKSSRPTCQQELDP